MWKKNLNSEISYLRCKHKEEATILSIHRCSSGSFSENWITGGLRLPARFVSGGYNSGTSNSWMLTVCTSNNPIGVTSGVSQLHFARLLRGGPGRLAINPQSVAPRAGPRPGGPPGAGPWLLLFGAPKEANKEHRGWCAKCLLQKGGSGSRLGPVIDLNSV